MNAIENQRQRLLFGGIHIVLSDGSKPSGQAREMEDFSDYGKYWKFPYSSNYSSNCHFWQLLETTEPGVNNGRLHRMTYGNGAWVEYTYDLFDRVTKESHSDGTEHYYFYDTEDRLTRQCSVKNGTVTGVYTFVYDSLGRLIRSKQTSDGTLHANTVDEGTTVQQTQHLYDQENRITRQSWTIQGKTYSESYTYNDSTNSSGTLKDGSIRSIEYQPLKKTVTFGYDNLKHLNSIVVPGVYQRLFGYKTLSTNRSSNLVSSMSYSANTGSGLSTVYYNYSYSSIPRLTSSPNGSRISCRVGTMIAG